VTVLFGLPPVLSGVPGQGGEDIGELQDLAHLPMRIDHGVAASMTDGGVAARHQRADASAVQERHPGQVDDHPGTVLCT